MNYKEQIKHPNWQKKRLEIFERDNWQCQNCGAKDNTLNVHHKWYSFNKQIWDYTDLCFITLCNDCHEGIHILKDLIKECIDVNYTFIDELDLIYEILGYLGGRNIEGLIDIRNILTKKHYG